MVYISLLIPKPLNGFCNVRIKLTVSTILFIPVQSIASRSSSKIISWFNQWNAVEQFCVHRIFNSILLFMFNAGKKTNETFFFLFAFIFISFIFFILLLLSFYVGKVFSLICGRNFPTESACSPKLLGFFHIGWVRLMGFLFYIKIFFIFFLSPQTHAHIKTTNCGSPWPKLRYVPIQHHHQHYI